MAIRTRIFRPSLIALIALAPLGPVREARADEVCGDASCPKGFRCETIESLCPDIDCVEGAEPCPACEPRAEEVCVPVACTSDADCATDMSCVAEERTRCEGDTASDCGDAREGEEKPDCAPAPATNCTTELVRQCVPRWQLPCTSAADCGAGFECKELETCGCAGSEGSGGGSDPGLPEPDDSGERAATPAAPDCSCEPSGEFACVVIEAACSTDANCPAGWSCEDNGKGVCWSGPEGEGCEPADPAKLCAPPYSRLGGGRGVDLDDGETSGSGNGAPEGPVTSGNEGGSDQKDSEVVTTERGCSVTGSPRSPSAAAMWLMLGLAGALVSRRRR